MNNKKRKEICFYDNKKWVKRDLKSALNYIYNTQCDRIGEHMDANPDKFGNDIPFYDNILHIIMDVTNHDSKMKTDNVNFIHKINNVIFYNQLFKFNNNPTKTKIITNQSTKADIFIQNFN
jgi:hypothetical protein